MLVLEMYELFDVITITPLGAKFDARYNPITIATK
jgi:hypothetical protein